MADTHVTRIKASDSKASAGKKNSAQKLNAEKPQKKASKRPSTPSTNVVVRALQSIAGYFKGAWFELRQVRWPSRGATWSLTGAVLLFSAFFIVLILLLDAFFKYIFELILS